MWRGPHQSVSIWTLAGAIDFDNSLRMKASSIRIAFSSHQQRSHGRHVQTYPTTKAKFRRVDIGHNEAESVMLRFGFYLVEFNEAVDVLLDLMGQMFVHSSLFRSVALSTAGLMDSGYTGAIGAMLQVVSPHGLLLYRDARLAQIVFYQMSEPVTGYSGTCRAHLQCDEAVLVVWLVVAIYAVVARGFRRGSADYIA